jgi:hypothetical protein
MNPQNPQPTYPPVDLSLLGEGHVRAYRETDGEKGYIWNGVPILLLTSKGRVSGEPRVQVQVKARTFAATARTAQSPERDRLWLEATKMWPKYDQYQARTTRTIPMVVIEPTR